MKQILVSLACGLTVGYVALFAMQGGCTPAQQTAVKTAVDVANDACKVAFGSTPEQLPVGVSIEDFCKRSDVVRTFIDSFMGAKLAASRNPGSYTDAGAK